MVGSTLVTICGRRSWSGSRTGRRFGGRRRSKSGVSVLTWRFFKSNYFILLFHSSREETDLEGRVGAGLEASEEAGVDQGEETDLEGREGPGVAH